MPARHADLPRLAPPAYLGHACVHWVHATSGRQKGWLDERFHSGFREALLHGLARSALACPTYCLMPDHAHLLVVGLSESSDQLSFSKRLRADLNRRLSPARLQKQAYDHALRDHERERGAFESIAHYILENPTRAGLCSDASSYAFSGCMFPGYFGLDPFADGYWETFWKLYNRAVGSLSTSATRERRPRTES